MRKRVAIAAGALQLGLGIAVAAFVVVRERQGRDVRGSLTVEFEPTQPTRAAEPPQLVWPLYGFDAARVRAPVGFDVRPPFRSQPVWTFAAHALLEFPPVIGYRRIFFVNNAGTVFAVDERSGNLAWRYRSHRCSAASPGLGRGRVYVALMNRPPCNASGGRLDGRLIAFDARSGRRVWERQIGPTESSPLVAGNVVYVGDWARKVYAFTASTGNLRWSYATGDKVKGAAALSNGRVYIGSYDGHVYALDARTGKLRWRASAQQRLGPTGTFYSTPAVAYGRVYIGSTDGKVYSFGATTGKLRWSQGTGNYVYASPAVWRGLVLVGSYDGTFYALDAATGDVRWRFAAGGRISGSASVVAGIVYFSTLKGRTYGLDARTGRVRFSYPTGQYAAVVASRRRLYLVGYSKLYALIERTSAPPRAGARK